MDKKLSRHLKHLKAFNNQRKAWLFLSLFVVVSVGKVVFDWGFLESHHLLWAVATAGLVVSVLWWYWTMSLIRQLLDQRKEESEILVSIVHSIKEIQEDVKKLPK